VNALLVGLDLLKKALKARPALSGPRARRRLLIMGTLDAQARGGAWGCCGGAGGALWWDGTGIQAWECERRAMTETRARKHMLMMGTLDAHAGGGQEGGGGGAGGQGGGQEGGGAW
jgi:hypothetical protein